MFADKVSSLEIEPMPEWAGIYVNAWSSLRDDRAVYPSGMISGIYYTSKSQYARDAGLVGEDIRNFMVFVSALDAEYVAWIAEKMPKPEDKETK